VIFSAVIGSKEAIKGLMLSSITSHIEQLRDERELVQVFNESLFKRNKFVLGAIAQNRASSAILLDEIAKLSDRELHIKMGSLFPILGKNRKGLAVMRLVVLNPNTSPGTIEFLANSSSDEYVLGNIAGSPKVSLETLSRLERKKNYLIDWGLAGNRRTTSEIFEKLLTREQHFTHRTTLEIMLRNGQLPKEIQSRASEALKTYKK